MSYETEIIKQLAKFGKNGTANPDAKSNTGRLLGEAFMWDKIMAYAKQKSEAAWDTLESEGILPAEGTLSPGDHQIIESPNFSILAQVTNPVKRFNGDELATLMAKSKYKVPISTTKEFIDQAKVPGKSQVRLKIIERS